MAVLASPTEGEAVGLSVRRATRPINIAVRIAIVFTLVISVSRVFGPAILNSMLPMHEALVQLLDDRYEIHLVLSNVTGHDRVGSDLVVLGKAQAKRTIFMAKDEGLTPIQAGSTLTCSSTTGLLLQPAIMILGILMAWPFRTAKEMPQRAAIGGAFLAGWFTLGIPLMWWVCFQTIPLKVFDPSAFSMFHLANKFILNSGGMVCAALLCAMTITYCQRERPTE